MSTATQDLAWTRGLPSNVDAERFVLSSILLRGEAFDNVAAIVLPEDFSLEVHRKVFARMADLSRRGEVIDRVTVANELQSAGQLESIGGLTYLISLDEGMPDVVNIEAYIRIVQDKALKRRAIFAHQAAMDELLMDESEAADVLARSEKRISEIRVSGRASGGFAAPNQIIRDSGGIEEFLAPRSLAGLSTPWAGLNGLLTGYGFSAGQLIIVGGRPGAGKTAFAANLATHAAQRAKTYFVSLEMTSAEILRRMVCAQAQVNMYRLQRATNDWERGQIQQAIGELLDDEKPGLKILDQPNTSVMSLRAELRREAARGSVGMVIIDYLQLMETPGRRESSTRNEAVAEITRGLKLLARELKCSMVVLSQLSRSSDKEDREPKLSDLRDSGSIEQDADIVVFPYSKRILGELPEVIPYELILAKQRNGPVGRVGLNFYRKHTRFADAT